MERLAEALSERVEGEITRVYNEIMIIIEKIVRSEDGSGNKTRLLRSHEPIMHIELKNQVIPIILTTNLDRCAERADNLLKDMVGIKKTKIFGAMIFAYSYMFNPIFHILSMGDAQLDTEHMTKYYLPILYRFIEETPTRLAFDLEMKWLPKDDVPISAFTDRTDDGRWAEIKRKICSLVDRVPRKDIQPTSYDPRFTGVTAALRSLGVEMNKIPFPIELAAVNPNGVVEKIKTILREEAEVRKFPINHPSGQWYITVTQVLVAGRIIVMVYDVIRFTAFMIDEQDELSPFMIMTQLCYSAWLLERRGIDRYKWVYSLLRSYREHVCRKKDDGKKYVIQPVSSWIKYYFYRS